MGAHAIAPITDARWAEAQAGELAFWNSPHATQKLCRQLDGIYAEHLGITATMAAGLTVLDIGGGPHPLAVVLDLPVAAVTVVDPIPYEVADPPYIARRVEPAERYNGPMFDEVWGYNVLQHVLDPAAVLRTAKAHARVVRWFDWVDSAIEPHHPHSFSANWLASQFADWRIVSDQRGTAQVGRTQRYIAIVAERPT